MTFGERDNLKNGNLLLSYGSAEDKAAADKGYKFLGVTVDVKGREVHVFELKSLSEYNLEELSPGEG